MKDQKLLTQLNSLYSRLLDGTLHMRSTEIALYNALLMKSNRISMKKFSTFKDEFYFQASEEELKRTSGLAHGTLLKSREKLVEKNLIRYYKGKPFTGSEYKPKAALYSIVHLPYHKLKKRDEPEEIVIPELDEAVQICTDPIVQNCTDPIVQICTNANAFASSKLNAYKDIYRFIYRGKHTPISIAPELIELTEQLRDLPVKWFKALDEKDIHLTESESIIHLKKMSAAVNRYGYEQTSALIDTAIERRYTSINYDQLASESGQKPAALTVPEELIITD